MRHFWVFCTQLRTTKCEYLPGFSYCLICLMAYASISYLNFKNLLPLCSEMFVLGLFKQWLSINIFMFLLVAQLILAAEYAQPFLMLCCQLQTNWLITMVCCVQVWLFDKHKGQIYHGHDWSWCQRCRCQKCKLLNSLPYFNETC